MTSQRDVIYETMVSYMRPLKHIFVDGVSDVSDVQSWQYNFIIVLVSNCHCVLTEKISPGTYWTPLVLSVVQHYQL